MPKKNKIINPIRIMSNTVKSIRSGARGSFVHTRSCIQKDLKIIILGIEIDAPNNTYEKVGFRVCIRKIK